MDRALRASDLQSPPTLQNTPTLFFYQGSTSRGFSLLQLFLTEVHLINVFFTLLQNLFFLTVLWRSNTSHIFITVFPLVVAPEQKSEDCLSEKKIRRKEKFSGSREEHVHVNRAKVKRERADWIQNIILCWSRTIGPSVRIRRDEQHHRFKLLYAVH